MRASPKYPISDDNCELHNLNGMPACTLGKLENAEVLVPGHGWLMGWKDHTGHRQVVASVCGADP